MDKVLDYLQRMEGRINGKFDAIGGRLDKQDSRLDAIESRLDKQDSRLDSIENRLDKHDGRFDSIENKLNEHDSRFDKLEHRIAATELTIENDIKTYCNALADGHQITQRRLDSMEQLLKDINRDYIVSRLSHLEYEVKELQEKCNRIA